MKIALKAVLILGVLAVVLLVGFQNCGSTFAVKSGLELSSMSKVSSRSVIILGGEGFLQTYAFDHASESLTVRQRTPLAPISMAPASPGWLAYDAQTSAVFMIDSSAPQLTRFSINPATGSLQSPITLPVGAPAVHLNLDRINDDLVLYGASYNAGKFSVDNLGRDGMTSTHEETATFTASAKTHSSAIDHERNLIFVANKGENAVVIHSRAGSTLNEIGRISIPSPRTVKYDEIYRRLYVVTESANDESRTEIFDVTVISPTSAVAASRGLHAMGSLGSALSIDHEHNMLISTVREVGNESIQLIPVTPEGLPDPTRESASQSVPCVQARSLDASTDGRYLFLTCNSRTNAADLYVYRITYDSLNRVRFLTLAASADAGTSNFLSHLVIEP